MKICLISDNGNSSLNLDFTKYFSQEKHSYKDIYDGKIKYSSHKHKQMLKNIMDTYISYNYQVEKCMFAEDIVCEWFEDAMKEDISQEQKDILDRNYQWFRGKYKK